MSQIIAIKRDLEIEFLWDSFVSDEIQSSRLLSKDNGKVWVFEKPHSAHEGKACKIAIGAVGSAVALQVVALRIGIDEEFTIAPSVRSLIVQLVPFMRAALTEAGIFQNGVITIGQESSNTSFVVGVSSGKENVLAVVNSSLTVLTYDDPYAIIGCQSDAARALWYQREDERRPHDYGWMVDTMRICQRISPYIKQPYHSCII